MGAIFSAISVGQNFFVYAGLFFLLLLSGVGLPIPEEATTLFGGYLAYSGTLDIWVVMIVLVCGNILGDISGYAAGRFYGDWLYKKIFHRFRKTRLLFKRGEHYFSRYGEKIVLFTRPLMGVRFVIPILSGHYKMNFPKFLLYDALITAPWTIFLVSLSYFLGNGLELITEAKEVRHTVFVTIGLVILLYGAIQYIRQDEKEENGK